ncbi:MULTISPECIES: flagellar export chaperone FliS [Sphingomonas]|uniref:flagellar export chaperone FliS n=1 Tax=Sphingomonas TaxID=13687 RepID=UPI0008300341|nr:flagellar export chaperone FliS [Sphingomonas sp. CCH10-B3]
MLSQAAARASRADTAYRSIDVAGRTALGDPHALVSVMYEEVTRALGAVAAAIRNNDQALKSEKISRALTILFALESGLDFDKGGDVSYTLANLYRGARKQIVAASLGNDPAPFLNVARNLGEIAAVWRQIKAA